MEKYYSLLSAVGLLILPLAALLIYFLELRMQTRFIPRVEVDLESYERSLSGLDQAVANHANYLWRVPQLRNQLAKQKGVAQLPSFYIDKFEVNQRNYRKFLGWLALQPLEKRFSYAHPSEPVGYTYNNPNSEHKILGRLDISASGITFYAAYSYCQAAGGSLPSVEQWMAAAGGAEGRSYPWGEDFIGDPWRYSDPLLNLAAPLDNRRMNITPQKVFDMGNGLSEWTLNSTADGRFIQKGGNNYNRPFMLQSLNFIERPAPTDFSSKYNGFRCVYDTTASVSKATKKTKFPWQGEADAVLIKGGSFPLSVTSNSYAPKLMTYLDKSTPDVIRSFLSVPLSTSAGDSVVAFSKYEISCADYRRFLRDPLVRLGFYANKNQPKSHSYIPDNWQEQLANPKLPVVGIDWWSAYTYAKWAGGRLPSEQEWLRVFGGTEKNPYSWGKEYKSGLAHVRDKNAGIFPETPVEVKSETEDVTTDGIVALGGNISEWTNTVAFYDNSINMIVKGGNYKFPGNLGAHYSYDAQVPPNHRSDVIGIRVVFINE